MWQRGNWWEAYFSLFLSCSFWFSFSTLTRFFLLFPLAYFLSIFTILLFLSLFPSVFYIFQFTNFLVVELQVWNLERKVQVTWRNHSLPWREQAQGWSGQTCSSLLCCSSRPPAINVISRLLANEHFYPLHLNLFQYPSLPECRWNVECGERWTMVQQLGRCPCLPLHIEV